MIDSLLVLIEHDLSAVAYINELQPKALVRARSAVAAGQPVFADDVVDIAQLDLGVPINPNVGFVLVRSFGWRKSLLYDFGPLKDPPKPRTFDLAHVMAKQALELLKGNLQDDARPIAAESNLTRMQAGLTELGTLLSERVDAEATYQALLESNSWFLSGQYGDVQRHPELDEGTIPDFIATRHHDSFMDVIELKQPFLPCFRKDGGFSSEFNDAWNQLERYISFARRNRDYLRNEKGLRFENPRGILIMGHELSERQLRDIRDKEAMNPTVSVVTYDQLVALARAMYNLAAAAQDSAPPSSG
jgi:hypothetical protein